MTPLSGSTTQRLQNVIHTLRNVQGAIQGVQDVYTAASTDATASNTDMTNAKKPMATCLKDRGDISVAADGKTLVGLVGGTLGRLRKTEGKLMINSTNANNAGYPLTGLREEIASLSESAENADARAILKQSLGWMDRGTYFHAYAARSAGWSRSNAASGESRLSQVGNYLSAVARDNADGKNVSGDMATARPFIDMAIGYVGKHSTQMGETVTQEAQTIEALGQVQLHLAQALALSQPAPPPQPPSQPSAHHSSLAEVLHANDPTP